MVGSPTHARAIQAETDEIADRAVHGPATSKSPAPEFGVGFRCWCSVSS